MNESVIFNAAVKLPQDQRPAFLDAACAGNQRLRAEVEGLLQEHDGAGNFMQRPAVATHPSPSGRGAGTAGHRAEGVVGVVNEGGATDLFRPITEGPGTVIGPYKLLQQI